MILLSDDITGRRFGKLTVTELYQPASTGLIWKCRCDCGNIIYVRSEMLLNRIKEDCGCTRHRGIHFDMR